MLVAYAPSGEGLERLPDTVGAPDGGSGALPEGAIGIDLHDPAPGEIAALGAAGIEVPSLADMEEIEVSNRLYRDAGREYLTVVLPGQSSIGHAVAAPVTFILGDGLLVTVRHHEPRPFQSFPTRADQSAAGCASAEHVFLGLVEEIVARLADLLEGAERVLDEEARQAFATEGRPDPVRLQATLRKVGQQGELIGRVRLALLTLERALSFHGAALRAKSRRVVLEALLRDILALTEQCSYLSSRISLTVDATLGLINLVQNATVRIVSVVAVLFLPPTLVASIYGMNFDAMPELQASWGYPAALVLMLVSAVGCYLVFKWKRWL